MKLFLLILDDMVEDYYLHAVFDDNDDSRKTIQGIVSEGCGYVIVKGEVIVRQEPSYDDY